MYYSQSTPWVFKVAMLALSLVRTGGVPRPSSVSTRDLFLPLALACCLAGAMLTPSLCYSVRQRAATTVLAVQTILMLSLTTALVTTIHASPQLANYASYALQFITCHLFYSLSRALSVDKNLLLFHGYFAPLATGLAVVLPLFIAMTTPQLETHVVPVVSLIFAGEVLGLLALVLSSLVKVLGDQYESALTWSLRMT